MKYDLIYKKPGTVEKVDGETMAQAINAKTDSRDPFMVVATKTVTTEGEPYQALMVEDNKCLILSKWPLDGDNPNDKTKFVEAATILEALNSVGPAGAFGFSAHGDVPYGTVITLNCELTEATVWFTTDGTDPVEGESTEWTGQTWTADANLTLKALAKYVTSEDPESGEKTYGYKNASTSVTPVVSAPVLSVASGNVEKYTELSITCETAAATIYYTTDGSTPTDASTAYSGAIQITEDMTVKAIAIVSGFGSSTVASASYHVVLPTVATPVFTPNPGNIGINETVTITCATDGATIYYTTDGSVPTTSSSVYSTPIVISESMTIKAFAVKADYNDSAVKSGQYTAVKPTVATPVITPASSAVAAGTTATITCGTDGAEIHYTTDGSVPTASSATYSDAIEITDGMTIKAISIKADYNNSAVASASYTVALPSYIGVVEGTVWGTDESRVADIQALESEVMNTAEMTHKFGPGITVDGFATYAFPSRLGTINYVKDIINGINYTDSVTKSTATINGAEYTIVRFTDYVGYETTDEVTLRYSANPIS